MQLLIWVGGVVLLLPKCNSDLTGPTAVDTIQGSSVSVECKYHQKYQQNKKYWCRKGESSCPAVVSTTGSEQPVIENRVSIKDNHSLNIFTVRMDDLTSDDSGMYSCAVSRAGGRDLMAPVKVTVLPSLQITDILDNSGSFHKSKSNSVRYQIYVPFLILICLKMPVFLTMILAIICMQRRNRQHPDEVTPETRS